MASETSHNFDGTGYMRKVAKPVVVAGKVFLVMAVVVFGGTEERAFQWQVT